MINLETTNWLLAVIALGSAVQILVTVGLAVAGYRIYRQTTEVYRQTTQAIAEFESRHVAPVRKQLDVILADVQSVTARVSQQTERVDQAINGTIDRVDETADRVKHSVRDKVSQATGIVRGLRAIIMSLLSTEPAGKPPAQADGRA